MARKSRRNTEIIPSASFVKAEVLPTAIYARLSVENGGKDDNGASIGNQIEVCKEYIRDIPDLQLVKVYQDNGWTGTVMRRPAFDELMEDIKKGAVKAIVVRDLSRFARNYIEIGTYIERIFPYLGVRFIAVKERFDTFTMGGNKESLMIPLQNLINDLYSKDISRKVEAALRTQIEEGTFKWRTLPYGYIWNCEHTNIVPDPERAPVVEMIFRWRADGVSSHEIVRKLNENKAPRYLGKNGELTGPWKMGSIFNMLHNPVYVGDRVMSRYHSAIYKGIKKSKVPQEEWIVFKDAHEAIISRELFEKVQEITRSNANRFKESKKETGPERSRIMDLFEGKSFCADCGSKMYFIKVKMKPGSQKMYGKYYCSQYHRTNGVSCTCHGISKRKLDEKVLAAINMQVDVALEKEKLIRKFCGSKEDKKTRSGMNREIQGAAGEIERMRLRKTRLYEDFVSGILDENEYTYAKCGYEEELERLDKRMQDLLEKRKAYEEAVSSDNRWISGLKRIKGKKKLTQEMVDAVVDRVVIHEGRSINLVMKYQDVFDYTNMLIGRAR